VDERLRKVRIAAIVALASDDFLASILVLKGGQALDLVHEIGSRSSLDIDYSLSKTLYEFAELALKAESALRVRFDDLGYELFDFRLDPRHSEAEVLGAEINFKLIERTQAQEMGNDLERMRRESLVVSKNQRRKLEIQLSLNELCTEDCETVVLDGIDLKVYRPRLIAIEKLRALCQQLPEYKLRANKTPRARDFYDIVAIQETTDLDFADPETQSLVRRVFAIKHVPLEFIGALKESREFHRPDWQSVIDSVPKSISLEPFDFYFERTLSLSSALEPLWNPESPVPI